MVSRPPSTYMLAHVYTHPSAANEGCQGNVTESSPLFQQGINEPVYQRECGLKAEQQEVRAGAVTLPTLG